MRIITVNIPESYIRAIKSLTGDGGLYPSRSELVRVAVREFLISELKAAKSFVKFQDELGNSPFIPKEEIKEPEFEVDIDEILGLYPQKEETEEKMASEIEYKTMHQQNFQRVPTLKAPPEIAGRVVDLGDRVKIDGKEWKFK